MIVYASADQISLNTTVVGRGSPSVGRELCLLNRDAGSDTSHADVAHIVVKSVLLPPVEN